MTMIQLIKKKKKQQLSAKNPKHRYKVMKRQSLYYGSLPPPLLKPSTQPRE